MSLPGLSRQHAALLLANLLLVILMAPLAAIGIATLMLPLTGFAVLLAALASRAALYRSPKMLKGTGIATGVLAWLFLASTGPWLVSADAVQVTKGIMIAMTVVPFCFWVGNLNLRHEELALTAGPPTTAAPRFSLIELLLVTAFVAAVLGMLRVLVNTRAA